MILELDQISFVFIKYLLKQVKHFIYCDLRRLLLTFLLLSA
jgi:hypothetical protein